MNLKFLFKKLIDEYGIVYSSVVSNEDWKNPFRELISKEIPSEIVSELKLTDTYKVVGSYGKGRWTQVPWISVFDKRITTSAQHGAYIVYLLNKDSKELFLAFELAATEEMSIAPKNGEKKAFASVINNSNSELTLKLKQKADQVRLIINNIYFFSDNEIKCGSPEYEAGTVFYKKYTLGNMPENAELVDDLQRMLEIYNQYYEKIYLPQNSWFPSKEQYDPGISKEKWLELLNTPNFFSDNALMSFAVFYDNGGQGTCSELEHKYGIKQGLYRNACTKLCEKVVSEISCPIYGGDEKEKYWPIAFVGRKTNSDEEGSFVWKIRPELYDALTEFDILRYLPMEHQKGKFYSWEVLSETAILKNIDKSFLVYNSTVVPKEIIWFFGDEIADNEGNRILNVAFNNKNFECRYFKDTNGSYTLYWYESLGELIKAKKYGISDKAVFTKNGDVYELTFEEETIEKGTFGSWNVIDKTTVIKTCDKSFFDHNGSGVPKELLWFFGGEIQGEGKNRYLNFVFNGGNYKARLEKDLEGRYRIFWATEIGNIFSKYSIGDQATFKRTSYNECVISFEGGESEMTTKQKIEEIKKYIAARGFTYEGKLIENFYLSLKSKPFVILAGTSGTGKTRLAKLFAEAIGAEFKLVPVRPDWSDSSDLFGHMDLSGNFVAGPVIKFISDAIKHPQKPYILCLDEMNLARVEYYFSDFLSIMETRERKDGRVVTDDFDLCDKAVEEFGKISIPDNLYIVGTVNMDETTFPFSKKVLDRANTIEFSYVDLSLPAEKPMMEDVVSFNVDNSFMKTEYIRLDECVKNTDTEAVASVICSELKDINEILKSADAHVGYRVRDDICFYMLNNYNARTDTEGCEEGLIKYNEAMDNQIMQKILPRIQGSSSAVKNMLSKLAKICIGNSSFELPEEIKTDFIDNISKTGKFKNSTRKILQMAKRFNEDGFTSYWI